MKKAIIIGLGPHGRRVVKAIENVKGLELSAVVDLNKEVLDNLELNGNSIAKYTNLQKALSELDIQVACITTNGPSHASLARQCMLAGVKYIMVEKPLTCSVSEAMDMMKLARQKEVRLTVDHPRRISKNYGLVKRMIEDGELGEIRNIYIQRPGIGLGCLGTHSFDLASYFMNKKVKKVTGWVDEPKKKNPRGENFQDPGGMAILDYGDGVKGIVSQIEDGAGPIFVEINLTKGRVHIDEKLDRLEVVRRDLNVKKAPGKPAAYEIILNPNGIGGKRVLVDEISWLLQNLISNEDIISKAQHGLDSIEVLVATYVSNENGNIPIAIPLEEKYHNKWLPVT